MRDSESLEDRIRQVGLALGLDAVGFASALPTERTRFLREWIARGYGGEMHYLERRLEERVDPRLVLADARSLIVVGLYCSEESGEAAGEDEAARGRIARYAGGDDYHEVLLDRVRALEAAMAVLVASPIR